MNIVRQSLKWLLTACLPEERWLIHGRHARSANGPAISLTFDDGPHPVHTPRVLDRLQEFGWKGTFFVIGKYAHQHPELIRRIVAEGHELGNHTLTHGEPSLTSAAVFMQELRETRQLLQQISGRNVSLLRPPKGELSFDKVRISWQQAQTVVLWNVDPKDYRPDAHAAVTRWAANYAPRHGDFVLLHDAFPLAVTALEELQKHSRLTGIDAVTVSEWLPCSKIHHEPSTLTPNLEFSAERATCL